MPFVATATEARTMTRVVSWFSCGAASAVASKLAIQKYGAVEIVYCDTMSTEHPDQQRFFDDVQRWLGQDIIRIKSEKYTDVDDVIEKRRYMAGIAGAPCTVEMKKVPRFAYQRPDDLHIFGLHAGEQDRADNLRANDPGLDMAFPLIDAGFGKQRCADTLTLAGVELPAMYHLGYSNNNCLGCVKATSYRYWQGIRHDFPEVFARRVRQSRELGVRLARVNDERIFLDELPEGYDPKDKGGRESISCGPDCGIQLVFA
jgi:hypothetical protein